VYVPHYREGHGGDHNHGNDKGHGKGKDHKHD
jgi:hypothetical protein